MSTVTHAGTEYTLDPANRLHESIRRQVREAEEVAGMLATAADRLARQAATLAAEVRESYGTFQAPSPQAYADVVALQARYQQAHQAVRVLLYAADLL